MSGMEMMLINMLKAFMPKEAAEKIAGYATDGTFDRIGSIPSELDAIRESLARQERMLAGLNRAFSVHLSETAMRHYEPARTDLLPGYSDGSGPDAVTPPECGPFGTGASAGASGIAHNGHGGNSGKIGTPGT